MNTNRTKRYRRLGQVDVDGKNVLSYNVYFVYVLVDIGHSVGNVGRVQRNRDSDEIVNVLKAVVTIKNKDVNIDGITEKMEKEVAVLMNVIYYSDYRYNVIYIRDGTICWKN